MPLRVETASTFCYLCSRPRRTGVEMNADDVGIGSSAPPGAAVGLAGVNFSAFSKPATRIELIPFDDENAARPARIRPLDASRHRTYHYWHAFDRSLKPERVYAYRAHGPFAPQWAAGPTARRCSSTLTGSP